MTEQPQPSGQQPPSPSPGTGATAARGVALAITHVTKIGGLAVVLNESLIRTDLRPSVLAISAFMMAGAHGLEGLVGRLLGK
jgi:hypothetical protein